MRWEYETFKWIAFGACIFALFLFAIGHALRRRTLKKAGSSRLTGLLLSFSLERRLFKQLLFFFALVLAVLAALRPQYGRSPAPLRQSGIDIAIAFDISKSMNARDVLPSRLQAARHELSVLIDSLHGHRIALCPFAGIAFPQSPLTADKSAIRLYLNSLDPKQMPVGGTNLAAAIREGTKLLTGKGDKGDRKSRSQVILLMTDGEDVSKDAGAAAREAAKAAGEAGIQIYAIAVGTRLGEPIPLLNKDGSHAGYQVDSEDKPIYSKLNRPLLEELVSLATPGISASDHVFELTADHSVAGELVAAFEHLQKNTLEQSLHHRHGEKFQFFLLPAIALLALEWPLSDRRRRKKQKQALESENETSDEAKEGGAQ